jgi:teichuronic acid exporter
VPKITQSETPFRGFVWKFIERCVTQGLKFIIQILLARLLFPYEYGIIALIAIFISIADTVVQSGLNTALIQKKDADEADFSTVLTTSIVLAMVSYVILFISASLIARIFEEAILTKVIRVLGINIFFGALYSVQIAYLSKKLLFKYNFLSSFVATIISGIISVYLAYRGYGVWAMVLQQLLQQIIAVVVLLLMLKWIPKFRFSFNRFKVLFSFGWKIMSASLVALFTEKAYSLFIGKIYDSKSLGFFDRGHQFPYVIVGNINSTINSVLLPVLSNKQDNIADLKRMARKAVSTSSFLVFPAMAGLIAIAEPLVKVLLTDKWLMCVPFLQLECLFYATLPISSANGQVTRAIGRSDISLWLEIIKTVLTILCLLLFHKLGMYVVVAMRAFISLIIVIISSVITQKLINYYFKERISDVLPPALLALGMGIVVYHVSLIGLSEVKTLIIQVIIGISLYFGLAYILRMKNMLYILSYVKKGLK